MMRRQRAVGRVAALIAHGRGETCRYTIKEKHISAAGRLKVRRGPAQEAPGPGGSWSRKLQILESPGPGGSQSRSLSVQEALGPGGSRPWSLPVLEDPGPGGSWSRRLPIPEALGP